MIPHLEDTGLKENYRYDLRTSPPRQFVDISETAWASLSWKRLGPPSRVENFSRHRQAWEEKDGGEMPVPIQWEHFNRHFHSLFLSHPNQESPRLRKELLRHLGRANLTGAAEVLEDLVQLRIWNHVHRVRDAVWDPRGKRALFEGLSVERPNILFLGAADGYEAMQLMAMYPGGHALLVDYDNFCRTDRFGKFPPAYPFLGQDPSTGNWSTYRRGNFDIDFLVEDIHQLDLEVAYDIVISVGLIEHVPDEHKPEIIAAHRRFLKPGGYAIFTTPRKQLKSRLFYLIMGEIMNFGYRELMTPRQLGLYVYENGFDIVRAGYIQAHNGIIARSR